MSRGSLTRYAALMRDVDPHGAHRIAKRSWHEHGAVTFLPDQIEKMAWQDRELLQALATKHYGPRQENDRNG